MALMSSDAVISLTCLISWDLVVDSSMGSSTGGFIGVSVFTVVKVFRMSPVVDVGSRRVLMIVHWASSGSATFSGRK